jgi:hypothetical protein
VWLRTLYVLVFIELQSRRVYVSPTTAHPDSSWVTQQARNLMMDLEDRSPALRFLIHDRDAKFSGSFDEVFRSGGTTVILTPIRAPNANAHAERWVETGEGRVPGLAARPGSSASRSSASDLRRSLKPPATASRARPRRALAGDRCSGPPSVLARCSAETYSAA